MNAGYETLIVTFSDPIKVLDNIFADADAWGTDNLKGWVEDYESTRFTQINEHTAVITSEYNMPCVKEWLTRCTAIADMRESRTHGCSSFTCPREMMRPATSVTCGAWEYPYTVMTFGTRTHAPLPSAPLNVCSKG